MRSATIVVFCVLQFWSCCGTNVRWNDIEQWDDYESGGQTLVKEFNGMYALFVQVAVEDVGDSISRINISCKPWATAQNWFLTNNGDVINDISTRFRGEGEYLLRHEMGDGANIDNGCFLLENDASVYLSFICSDIPNGVSQPPFVYGWVELEIDGQGNVVIRSSAYDLDGGPMVVGGGAWTGNIPEPSGGILLLIGAAVLGLRRVKELES